MPNWDKRYGKDWSRISKQVRLCTGGKCCYPSCKKDAVLVHHVLYKIKGRLIANTKFEKRGAGSVLFPLCAYHHSRRHTNGAHHPNNWKWDEKNPVDGNKNTPAYCQKLRQGFLEKVKAK
jgi:hypothetical protein